MPIRLLEKSSPTYKRRLAREIQENKHKGIYYQREGQKFRVIGARYSDGFLRVKINTPAGWERVRDENLDNFTDGNGREVCASREIRQ